MKAKPFFIGLTVGIVSGATAVLFTAPQSGEQVRSNIAKNTVCAQNTLNELQDKSAQVKHAITNLIDESKNNIPKILKDFYSSFSDFKNEIEPETTHLKQEIEVLQKSISEIEKNISQVTKKD